MRPIYLDNNATTPILPEVADAMRECWAAGYANPASQHHAGRQARAVLEQARSEIGQILGAEVSGPRRDRVLLTSGGTEANHLALRGLTGRRPGRLVISAIEHPSITGTAESLESEGWTIDRLAVDSGGVMCVADLAGLLTPETRLVSLMLGNNETGVLQPVEAAAEVCRRAGIPMHTDAVQVVGKLPVDFRQLGVNALTATAHKLHGPCGIGVLVVKHGVPLQPVLSGGFQQGGLRPGTESVVLAVGMQTALAVWKREADERARRLTALRERFEAELVNGPVEVVINGRGSPRLPHTTSASFIGLDRQALVMALDLAGVACSTGSACASGSSQPSGVLLAMGLEDRLVGGALRFSLGALNTAAEVEEALARIHRVCNELRQAKTSRKMAQAPPALSDKPI